MLHDIEPLIQEWADYTAKEGYGRTPESRIAAQRAAYSLQRRRRDNKSRQATFPPAQRETRAQRASAPLSMLPERLMRVERVMRRLDRGHMEVIRWKYLEPGYDEGMRMRMWCAENGASAATYFRYLHEIHEAVRDER